jgi:hypothetical protein
LLMTQLNDNRLDCLRIDNARVTGESLTKISNEELFTGLPPGVVRPKGLSRAILGGKGRPELQRMRNQVLGGVDGP